MFIIIPIAVCVAYLYLKKDDNKAYPEVSDPELSRKFNFHLIPDGKNNYRSAQFTEKELPYIIKKYKIRRIIRLNKNDSDSKHKPYLPETSTYTEKEICENLGCIFYYINPHKGYINNLGYTQSIYAVDIILKKGNTLIHCAHGADRTGGMVAAYLKKNRIIPNVNELWNYTTQYNDWEKLIDTGDFYKEGYDKYAEGFYPMYKLNKYE
jgi:hypothetical protein